MNTSPVSFASLVVAHLRAIAPKARTRTLDTVDVDAALREHAETVAANPGVAVRTRLVGGFVPNGYGYKAEGDYLQIETDAQGRTTYVATRRAWGAPSASYGRGDALRTWLLTPGGALKRAA